MQIGVDVVYCNLGTKTNTQDGDYECVAPQVIARADKFALSLVEFNKIASVDINFQAKITQTTGTTNLASVTINLVFNANYATNYGYMVLVVGHQPENTWIDLVNIELLNSTHNLFTPSNTTSKVVNFTYSYPQVTTRLSIDGTINNDWTMVAFTSSFHTNFIPSGDRSSFGLWFGQLKINQLIIQLKADQYTGLKTFIGGVVFYKILIQPVGIFYYGINLNLISSDLTNVQLYKSTTNSILLGPPFNRKCFYSLQMIAIRSGFRSYTLVNSTLSNYYKVLMGPNSSMQVQTFADFVCIASMAVTVCGQFQFEDPLDNLCYPNGSSCPVPTVESQVGKKWCKKCQQIECLSCDIANRSLCFTCDSTLFAVLGYDDQCRCQDGYGTIYLVVNGINIANGCGLCSSAIPNCISCSNVGACWSCTTGLFYNNVIQACQDCPTLRPKCAVCGSDAKCTQCISDYWPNFFGACTTCQGLHPNCLICDVTDGKCTQCSVGYGSDSTGQCVSCDIPYTNCVECNTDTAGCTLCFSDASTTYWLDSTNRCVDCQTLRPNCAGCNTPPSTECAQCNPTFGVNPSDDCEPCSTLYSNCNLCASYTGGCTWCLSGFGIDSSGLCDTCSSLYSAQCLQCINFNDGCTKCMTNYGIDSTGRCDSCLSLYLNCNLCTSYNTGCTQCAVTFGIASSAQCQPCFTLYPNCNLCSAYNTGCTECADHHGISSTLACEPCLTWYPQCSLCVSFLSGCSQCLPGYVLGPAGQCALCDFYFPNCYTCATYNGGCTQCDITYGVNSTGRCATCLSFYQNCAECTTHNGGCKLCMTGYGTVASGQCALCATLYNSNCLSCVTETEGCNSCKTGFGLDTLASCTACSTLHPNCDLCTSYNTGCESCSSGYGLTATDQCLLCSTLYQNCALCTSHDTGCNQCADIGNIYLLNTKQCKTCAQIAPQCTSCTPNPANSDLLCTQCARGYYLDSSQNACFPCSSAILDCEQCYLNTTISKVRCTLCSDQYLVDDRFLCEQCKVHIYYERMCYYLPGCSSLAVINETLICLACTLPNFEFSIKIKKCVCQKGFNFSTIDDTCNANCGDKLKVPIEGCDDGNLINGDGCNDLCKVETNYKCQQNNKSTSVCVFSQDIKFTLDYILKLQGENKAQIYFKVEPAPISLSGIDWQKAMSFDFIDLPKKPAISFSYENGILIATLAYFESIEEKRCEMNVKFDSSMIASKPQYLYFEVKASNGKLAYESQSVGENKKTVGMISFILGITALVCFMISNYFHKLIGLETIQFIQLIYFSRIVFSGDSQSNVLAFNSLKYSNGYSEVNLSGAKPNANMAEIPPIFSQIQLQMYYLDNCNTMIIPIILATLAYVVYFLRRTRANSVYQQTKQISIRDNIVEMGRKITWIYENFIFPYTLALLYLTLFQMLVYELSDLSDQSEVAAPHVRASFSISLLILLYIFSIFCAETIFGYKDYFGAVSDQASLKNQDKTLTDERHKDHHPLYIPIYLLYQLLLLVLVNTALLEFTYLTEVMAALILLYSIIYFCWKPYALSIHNYANIYNQLVLMLFFGLQILSKKISLGDTMKIVSLYGVLGLIVIALGIQMVRVHVFNKSEKRKFTVAQKTKSKPEQLKFIQPNNPYLVNKKISQMIANQDQLETNMNEAVDTTIYGREQLRRRLRQEKAAEAHKATLQNQNKVGYEENDKDILRKIKERIRKGQSYHQQWPFK